MSEDLVDSLFRYRSWSINSMLFDHKLVALQLFEEEKVVSYPFKFNFVWQEHDDFSQLVLSHYNSFYLDEDTYKMDYLVKKLSSLKSKVILWEKQKKRQLRQDLFHIEDQLEAFYAHQGPGLFSDQDIIYAKELEAKRTQILSIEEESWRLKS